MTVTWNAAPDQTQQDIADRRAVRAGVRDFLLARGAAVGATTSELVSRFGMSAVKRLNDLRKDDSEPWDYAGQRIGRTEHRYWLVVKARPVVDRRPTLEPEPDTRPGFLF